MARPTLRFLTITHIILCCVVTTETYCDWTPKVYNAIKWTASNQGKQTIVYTREHGVTQVPVAYHGGVDTNATGEITPKNIEQFTLWTQEFLPTNYCGPVVMDYERPWWKELRAKTILPDRLKEILSVYVKGVRVAKGLQPTAQWGYWGFPSTRHTSTNWLAQGHTTEPLIRQCRALYPEVYDCNRGIDRTTQVQQHITSVLKQAAGRMPVYVFVSPRYCGENKDRSLFVPDDIFLRQVNAVMRATWVDENNRQHRIKGLILWDAYGYTPESEWEDLDVKHKHYFELLTALTGAWASAMSGKEVITEPTDSGYCVDGLPAPMNSREAIYDKSTVELKSEPVKTERNNNSRVPSGRTKNE